MDQETWNNMSEDEQQTYLRGEEIIDPYGLLIRLIVVAVIAAWMTGWIMSVVY